MQFVYNDGGRSKYFTAQKVGDCGVRAICNATGKDYKEVYNAINRLAKTERTGVRKHSISNARNGVYRCTMHNYLSSIGWEWCPTMTIGSGCQVHLNERELPEGTLILNLSGHFSCVKNGVLYDTYDCSRGGTRCVYGYWRKDPSFVAPKKDDQKPKRATKKKRQKKTKKRVSDSVRIKRLEKRVAELEALIAELNK
jgi:hypothetical protein